MFAYFSECVHLRHVSNHCDICTAIQLGKPVGLIKLVWVRARTNQCLHPGHVEIGNEDIIETKCAVHVDYSNMQITYSSLDGLESFTANRTKRIERRSILDKAKLCKGGTDNCGYENGAADDIETRRITRDEWALELRLENGELHAWCGEARQEKSNWRLIFAQVVTSEL